MGGLGRLVSIETTSKGFAFGVLEGPERLIDWGSRRVKGDVSTFLSKLGRVVDRYRPDGIVLEEPAGSRKGLRARSWLAWAEQLAVDRGLKAYPIERQILVSTVKIYGSTKHELACAIAEAFPELELHLPDRRKPWESEPRALAMFVAVARAGIAFDIAQEKATVPSGRMGSPAEVDKSS